MAGLKDDFCTIVVCLEGCHGSGKTKLCEEFAARGFEVLDEAFLQMPEYALHPQSLVMETYWVAHWFQRLLKRHFELHRDSRKNASGPKYRILIADRSPYSAVFYSRRRGDLLEGVIQAQIEELRDNANIHIITVHVCVPRDVLWNRILHRLEREPERRKYREDSAEWLEETLRFYDNFHWDYSVTNDKDTIAEVMNGMVRKLDRLLQEERSLFPQEDPHWSMAMISPTRT